MSGRNVVSCSAAPSSATVKVERMSATQKLPVAAMTTTPT